MCQVKFKNIPQNLLIIFLTEWIDNTLYCDYIFNCENLIKILINIKCFDY